MIHVLLPQWQAACQRRAGCVREHLPQRRLVMACGNAERQRAFPRQGGAQ